MWSHRLEHTSYLGVLYRETVEEIEYKRISAECIDKWQRDEYRKTVLQNDEWLSKNPEPSYPSRFGGTGSGNRRPGSGSSNPFPESTSKVPEPMPPIDDDATDEEKQQQADFEKSRQAYIQWEKKLETEASKLYKNDLNRAREKAKDQSDRAANVDLAVLRGRGAEFVLEFTTIVVIIFATIVMGILDILQNEQIGTLLAAIAGYVLGRATTRTRSGAGGQASTEEERRTPVNISELTELIKVVAGPTRQAEQPSRPAESTVEKETQSKQQTAQKIN
jgi:hypothetical protein